MLAIGDNAPDFHLMTDEGKQLRRKDFSGKSLVLYFYPKDDTPGCTKQACAFRDDLRAYASAGATVIGVSLDSVKSHQAFKNKFALTFTLLTDEGAKVSKAYGVYKEKNMYGRTYWGIERTTFVIDPKGKIAAIFPKVKVDGHSVAVLSAVREAAVR